MTKGIDLTIEKTSCSEYWEGVPDELDVHISEELKAQIATAREFMEVNPFVHSVNIETPSSGFYINDEQMEVFQSEARFDVDQIIVFEDVCYLFVQSKWDWQLQAEFTIPV